MIFFRLEESFTLVISTEFTVVNISDPGSTLPAFSFSRPHSNKHSHVEICLEGQQRLNVLAVSTGC